MFELEEQCEPTEEGQHNRPKRIVLRKKKSRLVVEEEQSVGEQE